MAGAVGRNVQCLAVYLVCALLHLVYLNLELMINGSMMMIVNFESEGRGSRTSVALFFNGFCLSWLLFVGVFLFRIRERCDE